MYVYAAPCAPLARWYGRCAYLSSRYTFGRPEDRAHVSIGTNQREFHIGETIPLQLSFSSTVKDRYQINMAQYDRSGRMDYERFIISPARGAVDPLPNHTGSMGGITSFQFLGAEPWTIKLNINEWVRFTRPGEYPLIGKSEYLGR